MTRCGGIAIWNFPNERLVGRQYTLWVKKKNCTTFLRPIALEILNRYLPNLAQIKVSSFWTSCQSLFKSTLENSGAIWRITLNVNKQVIKVMNWQWLHHAVVSAMLLTIALLILPTEEKLWWWYTVSWITPQMAINHVQIRAIWWTKCLAQWTAVHKLQVSVFLAVWEGAPSCCTDH